MTTITVELPPVLKLFEVPPSDIEIIATRNFVTAGLHSNRFDALFKSIGAIVASGVMVVKNPVDGAITGATLILQGDISQGGTEIALGAFNSARSLYNVFVVFTTALVGLLPYLNPIMYSAIKISNTQLEQLQRDLNSEKKSVQEKETTLTSYKKDLESFEETLTKLGQALNSKETLSVDLNQTFENDLTKTFSSALTLIDNLAKSISTNQPSATPISLSGLTVPEKDQQYKKDLETFSPYFNALAKDLESLSDYMGQLTAKKSKHGQTQHVLGSINAPPILNQKNTHSHQQKKARPPKPTFTSEWRKLFAGIVSYIDNLKNQGKQLATSHESAIKLLNEEIKQLQSQVQTLKNLNKD